MGSSKMEASQRLLDACQGFLVKAVSLASSRMPPVWIYHRESCTRSWPSLRKRRKKEDNEKQRDLWTFRNNFLKYPQRRIFGVGRDLWRSSSPTSKKVTYPKSNTSETCLSQWAPFKTVSMHSKNVFYNKSIFQNLLFAIFKFNFCFCFYHRAFLRWLDSNKSYISILFLSLILDLWNSFKNYLIVFTMGVRYSHQLPYHSLV